MASFGLLILAVLLWTVEVFTESTNIPGGRGEPSCTDSPMAWQELHLFVFFSNKERRKLTINLTNDDRPYQRLHTVIDTIYDTVYNNCSLGTADTIDYIYYVDTYMNTIYICLIKMPDQLPLDLANHAIVCNDSIVPPTRTSCDDVIRDSGSPPSLGDKYSIFLAVWYIYESSVKKGDYGILAMEQLILEKIYLARAKNEVLWKEPCFWKSTHHQRHILNFCAGFVYREVTRWIKMIYITTRNMIFTLVLLQGMKELLFCFLMVLFLQIQFLKKSNNHSRYVVNMCARFSHHDECWGFAPSGEWLSFPST